MSKVLLIDDPSPWCSTVVSELEKAGHTVVQARDQQEAISAAAADERPSLVLVDLLLAARAGAGFVRRLRSLPGMKNTPMLLTTAGTNRQAAQNALGQAADEIITKDKQSLGAITQRLSKLPLSG